MFVRLSSSAPRGQIENVRSPTPTAFKLKTKYLLGEIEVLGHHIRNSGKELYSCLQLERSQALFAISQAYGYSLLLFSVF